MHLQDGTLEADLCVVTSPEDVLGGFPGASGPRRLGRLIDGARDLHLVDLLRELQHFEQLK